VDIVENELCLSLGVFVIALISSVVIIVRWRRFTPRIAKKTGLTPRDL
jgi:hypothetical protein